MAECLSNPVQKRSREGKCLRGDKGVGAEELPPIAALGHLPDLPRVFCIQLLVPLPKLKMLRLEFSTICWSLEGMKGHVRKVSHFQ